MQFEVTVKFRYRADPINYPDPAPEAITALDKLAFSNDTEVLFDALQYSPYTAKIAVVSEFNEPEL